MKLKNHLPLIVILVFYAMVLALNIGAYASGSDQSGYLNFARLISLKKLHEKQRVVEEFSEIETPPNLYVPLGFAPYKMDEITPTYPAGLPILIWITSLFSGMDAAPHVLILLHSIASLILIYAFALALNLEKFWAIVAVVLLAINPLFMNYSLQLMSDMPSLFWCGLAVFAGLRNSQKKWAMIAGAAVGVAVLIRPVNILIIIPLLISFRKNWRGLIYCGVAGLPFAVLLLVLNFNLYGKFVTTGYGDVSYLFSFKNLSRSLEAYRQYLPLELTPFVILALGVFLPKISPQIKEKRLVIAAWILPFLVFYAFYYHTSETWWYMRFLLPIFLPIILIMVLCVRNICESQPRFRRTMIIFFLSFSFFWQIGVVMRFSVISWPPSSWDFSYFKISSWANKNLPKNSIVIAMENSGSLFYYTDFAIIRYDVLSKEELEKMKLIAQKIHRPIYAIIRPLEFDEVLKIKIPHDWENLIKIDEMTVWRLNEK